MIPTCDIRVGDVRDVLKMLPSESVHCVVTSPPYWALRSYLPDDHPLKAREIGSEPTLEAWVETMVVVFREVRRVLRRDGTLWLNLGDCFWGAKNFTGTTDKTDGVFNRRATRLGNLTGHANHLPTNKGRLSHPTLKEKDLCGQPWRAAFALQADGWYLRSDIVWAKPAPMPESVTDRPARAHEMLFLLSKSPRYFYDNEGAKEEASKNTHARGDGMNPKRRAASRSDVAANATFPAADLVTTRNMRSVWTIGAQPQQHDPDDANHYAAYPPDLVAPCVKAGTSRKGCCPTCGTPWVREVERAPMVVARSSRAKRVGVRTGASGTVVSPPTSATIGWSQDCLCPAADPIPCSVLDPFSGTGTTGLVSLAYGCNYVGIDLDERHAAKSRRRIATDLPAFAHVVAAQGKKPLPLFDGTVQP